MSALMSVNVGKATPSEHSDEPVTGIDKRPTEGAVLLSAPEEGSGVAGDDVCDRRHHGGPDQAVYAFAWEDLTTWSDRIERTIEPGIFGENLTTVGVDVTGAVIGEHWRVGGALLEVSTPRIPCRTFAGFLGERGWIRRFTREARPGAYLRVLEPGEVRAGDAVEIVHRPGHGVDIGTVFRALTTAPELLPKLLDVEALPDKAREKARRRLSGHVDPVSERLRDHD
ncbi:MOSC domain-containing protein [Yinghuangia sp. ASG 101]|uniref:MOSC domain-containing protein n=1 Tax=Yinghuangia sp. ASG 101 TaxID=2896848 RepID=UPI001E4A341F|nr:MOSC domain-containing protein [Yinghuangia sp. ASG 101]UGQ14718.1 MOSC domain-containing protein [Yinghuangia sp. ASG 101]